MLLHLLRQELAAAGALAVRQAARRPRRLPAPAHAVQRLQLVGHARRERLALLVRAERAGLARQLRVGQHHKRLPALAQTCRQASAVSGDAVRGAASASCCSGIASSRTRHVAADGNSQAMTFKRLGGAGTQGSTVSGRAHMRPGCGPCGRAPRAAGCRRPRRRRCRSTPPARTRAPGHRARARSRWGPHWCPCAHAPAPRLVKQATSVL